MPEKDYKKILGFSDEWVSLGVLSEDELAQLRAEFDTGRDPNTEHYRYRVFQGYLMRHRLLSEEMALALYELGASDPDYGMGGAMMADIVRMPACPESIIAKALVSDHKHLVRLAERKREVEPEIAEDMTTQAMFDRCLGDRSVQQELLKRPELTVEQLEVLATEGANHGVRNWASRRLRLTKRHNEKPPSKDEGLS